MDRIGFVPPLRLGHVETQLDWDMGPRGSCVQRLITTLDDPTAYDKIDQQSIHRLRLFFYNGMPCAWNQMNSRKP